MSSAKVLGWIFVGLFVLELIGYEVLQANQAGDTSLGMTVLAMAWIFGLWTELVLLMVFLIAWVAEGTQFDQAREEDAAHFKPGPITLQQRGPEQQAQRAS